MLTGRLGQSERDDPVVCAGYSLLTDPGAVLFKNYNWVLMIDKTGTKNAVAPSDLMIGDCYNQYYYQFDICLGCHACPAITNKNSYGYILRNTDSHQLESFDIFAKNR